MAKQSQKKTNNESSKIQTTTAWASSGNIREFFITLNQIKNSGISSVITKEIKREVHEGDIQTAGL